MLVIAVPSASRLVCKPSASAHASESLPASVMKMPANPASSAAFAQSISVAGGESGSVENASAILAMVVVPFDKDMAQFHRQRRPSRRRGRRLREPATEGALRERVIRILVLFARAERLPNSRSGVQGEREDTMKGLGLGILSGLLLISMARPGFAKDL